MASPLTVERRVRKRTVFGSFSTASTRETLYTCPANCSADIVGVFAGQTAGTLVTCSLSVYKALDDAWYEIAHEVSLAGLLETTYEDTSIVLEAGDKVAVTPFGSTPQVDAFVTVEETFIPVG